MEWQSTDVRGVLDKIESNRNGLTQEDAELRLKQYGINELKRLNGINPAKIFLNQFNSFLVIILIIATALSVFVGEIIDATAIMVIVILNAVFGFIQEFKAEKSMEALAKMTSQESIVVRNGEKIRIHSSKLVPGDIIILEQGDKVPADARLIDVTELRIDESMLTGESSSVKKGIGICKTSTIAEMKSMVFMGTIVSYGRATAVVTETGMSTQMGRIAHMIQTAGNDPTPLQKSLDKFGKELGILILAISVVVIFFSMLRGWVLTDAVIMGIALAVAAIPEGLGAVVTVTLAAGMRNMAKRKAIIRKLHAVETLGSVSVICSDKTGTLTKNEMTVRKVWYNKGVIDVMGMGYEPKGEFLSHGNVLENDEQLKRLLRTGMLCTNAQMKATVDGWTVMGDPTEGAIIVAAEKANLRKDEAESQNPRILEVPFTSERKMMSTVNKYGKKYIMCTKGAIESVTGCCTKIQLGGRTVQLTNSIKEDLLEANTEMAKHALRVLAIAYKEMDNTKPEEDNLVFLGMVGMIDPPRPEVIHDIERCTNAGIKTVMITGDNKDTAMAIGKEIKLSEGKLLTGEELNKMSDAELEEAVENVSIYARVNPEHKARIVDALQKKGHVIAMTGDGVNDAPALKKADIGVSMGIKGTDVAKEASDMVLADDNFTSIVAAVEDGRSIYDNIRSFIFYLLSANIAEVMVVFSAIIIGFTGPSGYIMPLTAVQLLWVNLVTDGLPAMALGVDPAAPRIMLRKPRDPKEKILSKKTLMNTFAAAALMAVITLGLFVYYLPDYKATTVAFTALVILEMIRIFKVRANFGQKLFSNPKLFAAVGTSIILQFFVLYFPGANEVFDTVPLLLSDWLVILCGLSIFALYSIASAMRSRT